MVVSEGRLRARTLELARPSYARTDDDISCDGRDKADIALTHVTTHTQFTLQTTIKFNTYYRRIIIIIIIIKISPVRALTVDF